MSVYIWVPFLEALRDATGGNPKVKRRDYLPEGPVPVLDQGQDYIAGYTTMNNAYVGQLPVVIFGDHTRIFKYVDFPFALGADGVKVLAPREGFDAYFLYHYFRTVNLPAQGYSRHFKFLRELSVCKPPLAEQRRIASILNRAARIERLRKQAQERLQEFVPALFVKMFGDPAINPMGWPDQKLGDVCLKTEQYNPGKQPTKEFKYVDISGVDNISKRINTFRSVLGAEAPSRARKRIRASDVLVSSVRPNLNAAAIVPDYLDSGIASTGFCVLRANQKILDPIYLFSQVCSTHFIDTMVSKARGINYPAVSDKDVKDILIPLPPLHIQNRFADIVEAMQATVAHIELGGLTAASLSTSLMSCLLTGDA